MKTITKEEFDFLQKEHEEGCKTSDYTRMIMSGDEKDQSMKKYIRDNDLCKHSRIKSYQGGQIDECLDCGKSWG